MVNPTYIVDGFGGGVYAYFTMIDSRVFKLFCIIAPLPVAPRQSKAKLPFYVLAMCVCVVREGRKEGIDPELVGPRFIAPARISSWREITAISIPPGTSTERSHPQGIYSPITLPLNGPFAMFVQKMMRSYEIWQARQGTSKLKPNHLSEGFGHQ